MMHELDFRHVADGQSQFVVAGSQQPFRKMPEAKVKPCSLLVGLAARRETLVEDFAP